MRTHKTGANLARRGLTALAGLAVVAGTLVGVAAPASALPPETITSNFTAWEQAGGASGLTTLDITINGFPNMTIANDGYPYQMVFYGMTPGLNSGSTCGASNVAFSTATNVGAGSTGATVPLGFVSGGVTYPGCRWADTSHFYFAYDSDQLFTSATVQTLSFAANAFAIPTNGAEFGVQLRGGGTWTGLVSSLCFGNCPVGTTAGNPVEITLDIDGNGGSCRTSKVTGIQNSWGRAPDATDCKREGYLFKGYNTSANGSGIEIRALGNIHFTGNNRIYAIWKSFNDITAPVPPKAVKAVGGWNSVTVSWDASPDPGDFEITNYMAASSPSNKGCITSVISYDPNRPTDANPLECKFTNLTPGTSYSFQVQALSGAGWGEKSAASNVATPYNMKITGYDRKKGNLFQLFKSTVTVSGVTPGYTVGTTITPWIKVGNGQWTKLPKEAFKTNLAGTFTWSKKFEKKLDGTPISVQFEDPQGNTSNSINTSEVGKLAPSVKINSARLNTSIVKPQITVIGTALNVPDDSRMTITFVQGKAKESVVIRLAKAGDFEVRWRPVDPNIPTVVKASVGGVESNPIRVAKRG